MNTNAPPPTPEPTVQDVNPTNLEIEVGENVVALLKCPLPVAELVGMIDHLQEAYGPDLRFMEKPKGWLAIFQTMNIIDPRAPRPTPETDAFILANAGFGPTDYQWRQHARRQERERDEARGQLKAMQEAIREAIDSLHKCSRVIGAPKTYDWADEDVCDAAYNSAQAALTKLQPFLP